MRVCYNYDTFSAAAKLGFEGFVNYEDHTVEFFETIDEADTVFEEASDAIAVGFVEEQLSKMRMVRETNVKRQRTYSDNIEPLSVPVDNTFLETMILTNLFLM